MPVHRQNGGGLSYESSGDCEMAGERLQKHSSGVVVSTIAMKTVVMAGLEQCTGLVPAVRPRRWHHLCLVFCPGDDTKTR